MTVQNLIPVDTILENCWPSRAFPISFLFCSFTWDWRSLQVWQTN